jgi:hypothetical protein
MMIVHHHRHPPAWLAKLPLLEEPKVLEGSGCGRKECVCECELWLAVGVKVWLMGSNDRGAIRGGGLDEGP